MKYGKDNPCSIPVLQYDMNDNLIKEWYSIADATRFYGLTHITDCCKEKEIILVDLNGNVRRN